MGIHKNFFFGENEGVGIFKNEYEILNICGDWFNYDKNKEYKNEVSDFIIKMCNEYKNLTLILIGIPKNIGCAIKKDPNIINQINELVIIVGSYLNQNYKNKFIFSK